MPRQVNLLKEVTAALCTRVQSDPDYRGFREKTTNLTVLGLRLPIIQEVERAGFSFSQNDSDKVLSVWDAIWNTSDVHEVMYLPLFYYRRHADILDPKHWRVMKRWIERVENWEHADALCQLYSLFLEHDRTLVEPTLKQWNPSKNPWKRRASIVSTIYYASKKRTPPPRSLVLSLAKPLLQDADPYVQKGVGWQLREAYNLWPHETLSFLESHILELPAITFSYATEKLDSKDKQRLKQKRIDARQNKKTRRGSGSRTSTRS